MTKIKMIAAAVAVASVSTLASAAPPPDAPPVYANGPFSPAVNITNLSSQERQAFALLEGIMQSVEGRIHAAGCTPVSLPLSVYSDALTTPSVGTAKLGSGPNSMTLTSAAEAPNANSFRGEAVDVDQAGPGYIANTPVSGYDGTMIYNSANNMMVGYMNAVNVMSINWVPNTFTGYVIKDFYLGQNTGPVGADTHIVYDWGLQSLSKEGYPVEKYWQRSKTRRSDGGQGATAFVKDRLVGVVPCRIAISLSGLNQFGVFQQSGTLTISGLTPGAPVPEIDNIPNI